MSAWACGGRGAGLLAAAYAVRALAVLLTAQLALGPAAWAQVVRDGSIGPAGGGLVPPGTDDLGQPATYLIEDNLGEQVGGNLFHSFSQFDVQTTETATFTSSDPASVSTILSRVTGPDPTHIYGRLRSTIPGAGLFLLSPSGIIVGPGAIIDVPGSVAFTTADHLKHSDAAGTRFQGTAVPSPVLVSQPIQAFGFLDSTIAPIEVQGADLAVPAGESLLLVGGNIDLLPGSRLTAPSGAVVLASVASQGTAGLSAPGQPVDVNTGGFPSLGNVSIAGGSEIDTSGDPAGRVVIRGGRLVIDDSVVRNDTTGDTDSVGTGIELEARSDLILSNAAEVHADPLAGGDASDIEILAGHLDLSADSLIGSLAAAGGRAGDLRIDAASVRVVGDATLRSSTDFGSSGDGGRIELTADTLEVDDGRLTTSTLGDGDAGAIDLDVRQLSLRNTGGLFATSGLSSTAGDAGSISITAGTVEAEDGVISALALGPSNAGAVTLTVDDLVLTHGGRVLANSVAGLNPTIGNAGIITVQATGTVSASGVGAFGSASGLYARAEDVGDAGTIRVDADVVHLSDQAAISTSSSSSGPARAGTVSVDAATAITIEQGAGAYSATTGTGNAGTVHLSAPAIRVESGGRVEARTFSGSTGDAGAVSIVADSVEVDDAFIRATTEGAGSSGTVDLQVGRLELSNGGQVSASTFAGSTGDAGRVTVDALADVVVSGEDASGTDSGIFAGTRGGGAGGRIEIRADRVRVADVADVNAGAFSGSSGDAGTVDIRAATSVEVVDLGGVFSDSSGSGDGGTVSVTAPNVRLADGGRLEARTFSGSTGNAGRVTVNADTLTLDDGDILTRTSGPGSAGEIDVRVGTLELLSSAQIVADSYGSGAGGTISIDADSITLVDGDITTNGNDLGGAGAITLDADQIRVTDNSTIGARVYSGSQGDAGTIDIDADTLYVDRSVIWTRTADVGSGGLIDIDVRELILRNAAFIESDTFFSSSTGNAGTVDIVADLVDLDDSVIRVVTRGQGDGGLIRLDVGDLLLTDGSWIEADAFSGSSGGAGTVSVTARDMVRITGGAGSELSAETFASGNAGRVDVVADTIVVEQGGEITALASGSNAGHAGTVDLTARTVTVDDGLLRGISFGPGDGGNVTVRTVDFNLINGGQVSASARDSIGHSGTVDINATGTVFIEGSGPAGFDAGIFSVNGGPQQGGGVRVSAGELYVGNDALIRSRTEGQGHAGPMVIDVDRLIVADGQISGTAVTGSTGNAADITITASESVRVSSPGSPGGGIFSTTRGAGTGGRISITAPEIALTSDGALQALSEDRGAGGTIELQGDRIEISDGFGISTSALDPFSAGAGRISIHATESVSITDKLTILFSQTMGIGDAGQISIVAPDFLLANAELTTRTTASGNAGMIDIQVDRMTALGDFDVRASAGSGSSGRAGTVNVNATESVIMRGQGFFAPGFFSETHGTGVGGNVIVTAPLFIIDDAHVQAVTFGLADAGTIHFDVGRLEIRDGAQVSSSAFDFNDPGNAGSVLIEASESVLISELVQVPALTGVLSSSGNSGSAGTITVITPLLEMEGFTAVQTAARGAGDAGTIDLQLGELIMRDLAEIASATSSTSTGDAGNIIVDASGPVSMSNAFLLTDSGGTGSGGSIALTAASLHMQDGSLIDSRTGVSGLAGATAGNIDIDTTGVVRLESSTINAESASSDGGNIDVSAAAVELFDSTISSSVDGGPATTGGNIRIAFPYWVILDYASGIIANAFQGQGGNIDISTQALLVSPNSTIDASSQLGVSGTVAVNAPDTNLAGSLAPLSDRYLADVQLRKDRCAELGTDDPGSFVLGAGSGVPETPDAPLSGLPLGRGRGGP